MKICEWAYIPARFSGKIQLSVTHYSRLLKVRSSPMLCRVHSNCDRRMMLSHSFSLPRLHSQNRANARLFADLHQLIFLWLLQKSQNDRELFGLTLSTHFYSIYPRMVIFIIKHSVCDHQYKLLISKLISKYYNNPLIAIIKNYN